MPASPYFTRIYFDPTYFDDDAATSGRPPRQLHVPLPVEEPTTLLDEELLEWII